MDVELVRDVDCSMNDNRSLVGIANLVQYVAEADQGNIFLLPEAPTEIHAHVTSVGLLTINRMSLTAN